MISGEEVLLFQIHTLYITFFLFILKRKTSRKISLCCVKKNTVKFQLEWREQMPFKNSWQDQKGWDVFVHLIGVLKGESEVDRPR